MGPVINHRTRVLRPQCLQAAAFCHTDTQRLQEPTWWRLLQRLGFAQILLVERIQSSLCLLHKRLSSCKVPLAGSLLLTDLAGNVCTLVSLHLCRLILCIHLLLLSPNL